MRLTEELAYKSLLCVYTLTVSAQTSDRKWGPMMRLFKMYLDFLVASELCGASVGVLFYTSICSCAL